MPMETKVSQLDYARTGSLRRDRSHRIAIGEVVDCHSER